LIDGASIEQPEVDQSCVPAATLSTAVSPQPADSLPTAASPQSEDTLPTAFFPQPAAEAHQLVLDLLAEEVFDAERFCAVWQLLEWWQPPDGKRKSPVGAAQPQPAADAAADWLAA